jgi:hypothetical protein
MTHDEKHVDLVAEATAQAAAGATTDPAHERGFDDVINGVEPDPDLAQGESD